MYSTLKNVQILVTLLKKYNIRHIVMSAGTRHTPLVYSVEQDNFFKTYSIVDERSASFFAIGLIEELHEPAAIVCTSGTAAANYVSAANEAFYQQLPLLLLTADRNHYYMFQQEEQMIPQEGLYSQVCKRVVTLGHVRDDKDFWYYSRLCNEALLDLTQGQMGPVHINFIVENNYPVTEGIVKFDQKELPEIHRIERLTGEDEISVWRHWSDKLKKSKVLILYGQYRPLTSEEVIVVNSFMEKYDCVISTDILSNASMNYSVPTFALSRSMSAKQMEELLPDIVITMNGNSISEMKLRLGYYSNRFEHWHVSANGQVSDPFKKLSDVVACSPIRFFERFARLAEQDTKHEYYDAWIQEYKKLGDNGVLNYENLEYSSIYAVQQAINNIPNKALLHIANSNSIRLSAYFNVDSSVTVYGNRGCHGIDGSMSAFIGQAHISGRPSYLIIGDLSFFYDMNALWNAYIGDNIHIIVCNNSGGAIFHTYPGLNNVPTLDEHIAAEHTTSVKEWVLSRGFEYYSVSNKDELEQAMPKWASTENKRPSILEVFTDKEEDTNAIASIMRPYVSSEESLRSTVSRMVPSVVKKMIKKVIK